MDGKNIENFIWVLSIACLVSFSFGFTPADDYLIDCGSPTNTTVDDRVFMSDNLASKLLSTPQTILASTSASATSSGDSVLYQTARILIQTSKYTFPIQEPGRHWIRLYFGPFKYNNYDMTQAKFSVSTQSHVLLSDFTVNSTNFKEFSLNVTTKDLVVTFTPSENSFAFINAIEVVSAPDELITDDAFMVGNKGKFQGLLWQALETVARVNMGGPKINSENDTLGRNWVSDVDFLVEKNLAKSVSQISAVNFVDGGSTEEIAPRTVYGTCTEMNSGDNPTSNFNVTWNFNVDTGYQYLLRFHFCDIVSSSLNQLYFNVYVDSEIVVRDLDLSTYLVNTLAAAYYMDYVTQAKKGSNSLRVSIGPSALNTDFPTAILNGLEIMKMNNSEGQLNGGANNLSPSSSSKKSVGLIVGAVVGPLFALVLVATFFLLYRKRRLGQAGHSKTWIPLSISGTSATMGSKFSNGTTTTSITSNIG